MKSKTRRPWEPSSISTDPEQWYAVLEWEMDRATQLEDELEQARAEIEELKLMVKLYMKGVIT
jgi:hypothetical protein